MSKTKLAFDLSSLLWTCLLVGKDTEGQDIEFEGKTVHVNTAAYGYENLINAVTAAMAEFRVAPIDCVFVPEGMNSKSGRLLIDRTYKGNRGKRPAEAYEQFQILRDQIVELFRSLGSIIVKQDNVEADDVLSWLAKNAKQRLIIVTNDNDLSALNGVNEFGAAVSVRVNGVLGENKYGLFPCKHISLYKALVGDSSDNITGIKGFGPKAWMEFDTRFGEKGMDYITGLLNADNLLALEADSEKDKFVKKLFDGRLDLQRSWKLAKLRPEWVDTMRNALDWKPGFVRGRVTDERLKKFSAMRRLVTAENWDSFVPWALRELEHRDWYALDIETSTPAESDDWLEALGSPDGVDTIGSTLTGMSLTFGFNMHLTVYISIDHADTLNVPKAQLIAFLKQIPLVVKSNPQPVIHNTMFEGPVLFNEFGEEWKDNGFEGFYPNWLDTRLEASYVDENNKLNLKYLSKRWLDYNQVDYATTTTIEGVPGTMVGGKELGIVLREVTPAVMGPSLSSEEVVLGVQQEVITPAVTEPIERRQYKMRELPATHVFDYACDDTATTSGLHNFFKLFMELEGTYDVYKHVELGASYLHAQSFVNGVDIDLPKLSELVAEDTASFEEAKTVLDAYLVAHGWDGTVCPVFTEVDANAIKVAHKVVTGTEFKTMVRTPSKLIAMLAETQPALAGACGKVEDLNEVVKHYFRAAPVLNTGSPKQLQALFYETMALPVRVYGKPTDNMKAAGQKVGTPKTDNLAIAYALLECTPEQKLTLEALRVMKMVETRRQLYYKPYPYFVHWKTGKVHSSHMQCGTNTRRASQAKPNLQQMSKNQKVEGFTPRVRELIVPHKKNAVIVSMDFMAQELRVIGDYSRDPGMLACFIGDDLRDMHAMTGLGIFNSTAEVSMLYPEFMSILGDSKHALYRQVKDCRRLGKLTNFVTEFGAAAPKLAQTLMVLVEDAQIFIDAKALAFPTVVDWKDTVIAEAKERGFVTTKLGARRHLREALMSDDRYISSKAERQAVNFKVQSSSAEMTKCAEGRMWEARLEQNFDCKIIAPIHDEVVASVAVEQLVDFCIAMHGCMVAPYGGMMVPIMSSISIGRSFGDQHECGELPTREALEAGLSAIGY